MDLLELAKEQHDSIVAIRRDIHKHPEIRFDVHRTAEIAARELEKAGITVKRGVGRTGVVGDIEVPGASKRIALRADMDALPMDELGTPPYKSTVAGKAHMCGHDAHTAMLIGAARILASLKNKLKAHVRFIFQPCEESLPGGAPGMIADGALEGVDEIYALHVWPSLPCGEIGICHGAAMGQPDIFSITITGKGGHAGTPHRTVDPIITGAQLVSSLQAIVSREVNAEDCAVISVTQFHAGSADNVIPDTATLSGTVRTYNSDLQRVLQRRMEEVVEGVCSAHGTSVKFNYMEGYPVTFNHAVSIEKAEIAGKGILGDDAVHSPGQRVLFGEDFAYYTEKIEGCYIQLGCRNPSLKSAPMLHDPHFDIDEQCLLHGMALHVNLALNFF
ncbi:MAG: amidohydrolase [Chlamydiales bacterium]|jgi:amidohydrolase